MTLISGDKDKYKIAICELLLEVNRSHNGPFIPPTAINWLGDRIIDELSYVSEQLYCVSTHYPDDGDNHENDNFTLIMAVSQANAMAKVKAWCEENFDFGLEFDVEGPITKFPHVL